MTFFSDIRTPVLPGQPRSRYQIDCAGAQLDVHTRSVATVVRIDGAVDAGNADAVARELRRFSLLRAPLVLDLSGLDFVASAGLEMLLALNGEHRRAGVPWCVVSGRALRRLTRVIPNHGLPIVDSVSAAVRHVAAVRAVRHRPTLGVARQQEPQRRSAMRDGRFFRNGGLNIVTGRG